MPSHAERVAVSCKARQSSRYLVSRACVPRDARWLRAACSMLSGDRGRAIVSRVCSLARTAHASTDAPTEDR
jgi:hypothetical protein